MTITDRKSGRKKRVTPTPTINHPDAEARARAAAVLEVMGGLSTPAAAAKAAGMSLPRYYALEKRALEGLVSACAAPGRKGRQVTPAREIERLREQVSRLERESSRNLAMARAAQRAAGFALPASAKAGSGDKAGASGGSGRKSRKRRPTARALAVAKVLREGMPGIGESSAPTPVQLSALAP